VIHIPNSFPPEVESGNRIISSKLKRVWPSETHDAAQKMPEMEYWDELPHFLNPRTPGTDRADNSQDIMAHLGKLDMTYR
jgi:hypothetical protein